LILDYTDIPSILREATVPIVANAMCNESYSNIGAIITDDQVCAG